MSDERKMLTLDEIEKEIRSQVIQNIQIDPNAVCGSNPPTGTNGCWFCPSAYYPRNNPSTMSSDFFEHVLSEIAEGIKLGFIGAGFTLWLSSYNDLLLAKHLKEYLDSLRRHKWRFSVLTNGVGLLKNVDLLNRYKDVIAGYLVDLPTGNAEDYARLTKNAPHIFEQIVQGLRELYNRDPGLYERTMVITVNGAYDDQVARAQLGYNLPIGDTDKQIKQLKYLFPYFNIHEARPLCDRAGLLADVGIIDNSVMSVRKWWKLPIENGGFAIGCNGGGESRLGRLGEWLHVGSSGDSRGTRGPLYTCCQDMLEESVYGNLRDSHLVDLIYSEERIIQIDKMLKSKCLRCWFSE